MTRRPPIVVCLLLLACLPAAAPAYIDMPAERLTLPRLLLEFRGAGVYKVGRIDPAQGLVRYDLVEAIAGDPPAQQKHSLRSGGKIPAELAGIAADARALLLGPDPYGRSLAFVDGAWYVTNLDRAAGWRRLAYTSAYYDFRCAFAGDLPRLVDACRALLDGQDATVPCRVKPKSPELADVTVSLREPHRRMTPAEATTRPAAARAYDEKTWAAKPLDDALNLLTSEASAVDRMMAARALGERPAAAGRAVPALVAAVKADKDPFVRRRAAASLGRLGPAAAAAVPTLMNRFTLGYENAADLAAFECAAAVRRIDPGGTAWLAEARRQLASEKPEHRRKAVDAVGIVGPPATPDTVALLTAATRDKAADVRYSAARALGMIEAETKTSVPALAALLSDPEKDVRSIAGATLRNVGPDAAAEAGRMLSADRPTETRRAACRALVVRHT